jgi:hypothetical protein
MYRLICQKPAHFFSAQMALVSIFLQMFIVLGIHNFVFFTKVSVHGVVALGGHFATLCQELDFDEAFFFIINFQLI